MTKSEKMRELRARLIEIERENQKLKLENDVLRKRVSVKCENCPVLLSAVRNHSFRNRP